MGRTKHFNFFFKRVMSVKKLIKNKKYIHDIKFNFLVLFGDEAEWVVEQKVEVH